MGVIGTHQYPLRIATGLADHIRDVVFRVAHHANMAHENLAGPLLELAAGPVAVLGGQQLDVWETFEKVPEHKRAEKIIESFEGDVENLETDCPNLNKFARTAREFAVYIRSNAACLINYGERYRAGEPISSSLAESTGNAVIS